MRHENGPPILGYATPARGRGRDWDFWVPALFAGAAILISIVCLLLFLLSLLNTLGR